MAHQDNSFLYRSTAGMFEDTYDYFKYSPAYLPSFKKSTLWSQLSNLENDSDRLFLGTVSSYYLLGGQTDLNGLAGLPGRAGLMLDYYTSTNPVASTAYAGPSHNGFGEYTYDEYRDLNADNIVDYQKETYGRSNQTDRYSSGDVYAVYGLGAAAGFDLGAGVRGQWSGYSPTYFSGNSRGTAYGSFEWVGRERQWDLTTGQLIYTRDEDGSGSWNYGNADWKLILGGRSKNLIPKMDLVANVTPLLHLQGNSVDWNHNVAYNNSPSDPNTISDYAANYHDKGVYYSGSALPSGTGFGILADVRADYPLTPGVLLTGKFNFQSVNTPYKNDNFEQNINIASHNSYFAGGLPALLAVTDATNIVYKYEGASGYTDISLKLRAQFPAKGWRLGLGINGESYAGKNDITTNYSFNDRYRYDAGTGDPADSYTTVSASGYKVREISESAITTLQFPVGLVLDLLNNFSLQMGVVHTLALTNTSLDRQYQERTLGVQTQTYDNGTTSTTLNSLGTNFPDAVHTSVFSVSEYSNAYTGATWFPFEQVQLDFYVGFANNQSYSNLLNLANYYVSANIYF